MTKPIHVPDLPGPLAKLCWQQNSRTPLVMWRCDRQKDHEGPHSWELDLVYEQFQTCQRALETARRQER